MKIAIIGYGEIGSSLAKVYQEKKMVPMIRDLDVNTIRGDVDILDICLPYGKNFISIVNDYIDEYLPKLTIIHSTVPIGTTKQIKRPCVHSPIRGVHPNLKEGIEKFVKFIGWNNPVDLALAKEHFQSLDIVFYPIENSDATELAKLTSTTYYGLCIAWHGEMKRLCDQLDVDFDEAVTDFNKTYNLGYDKLGKKNVIRPVLYPPDGKIGGHCIIQNAKMLGQIFESSALDLLKEYE